MLSSFNDFKNESFIRLIVDIKLGVGVAVVRPLLHIVEPLVDLGALEPRAFDGILEHLPPDWKLVPLEDLLQLVLLPREHELPADALADRLRAVAQVLGGGVCGGRARGGGRASHNFWCGTELVALERRHLHRPILYSREGLSLSFDGEGRLRLWLDHISISVQFWNFIGRILQIVLLAMIPLIRAALLWNERREHFQIATRHTAWKRLGHLPLWGQLVRNQRFCTITARTLAIKAGKRLLRVKYDSHFPVHDSQLPP